MRPALRRDAAGRAHFAVAIFSSLVDRRKCHRASNDRRRRAAEAQRGQPQEVPRSQTRYSRRAAGARRGEPQEVSRSQTRYTRRAAEARRGQPQELSRSEARHNRRAAEARRGQPQEASRSEARHNRRAAEARRGQPQEVPRRQTHSRSRRSHRPAAGLLQKAELQNLMRQSRRAQRRHRRPRVDDSHSSGVLDYRCRRADPTTGPRLPEEATRMHSQAQRQRRTLTGARSLSLLRKLPDSALWGIGLPIRLNPNALPGDC
jgi:hypothetical protein